MFELPWLPPYDWGWMFRFLQARAVTGAATVISAMGAGKTAAAAISSFLK